MTNSDNNKRIAKNTLLLYFRTLFTMAVSLYTSRIVLSVLGVNDFGIYNVVGGIVFFLSFLNTSMAGATQRFLNFEMGRGDKERVKLIFTNALIIHIIIALAVLLLAETVGVWFLNTQMNIDADRMVAANFVLQFSIATMLTTVISVPYNAAIIAHERMSAFAYISIIEVTLKLFAVLLLKYSPFDKLITYSFVMFPISLLIRLIYGAYCGKHFYECRRYKLKPDKKTIRQMMSFSAWTVVGALSSISHGHGISILMNIFFSVVVNAAYGVANQVNHVVSSFVNNFMTALNPQIVKSYSANDLNTMHKLISRGCRLGFLLVLFFVVPITMEAPTLLGIWLKQVPEYSINFVRLVLLATLLSSFASPLASAQAATGHIKSYQAVLTCLGLSHIPLAWIFFRLGYNPYYSMYVYIAIIAVEQIYRIIKVSNSVNMPICPFVCQLLSRSGAVCLISFIVAYLLHTVLSRGVISSLLTCVLSALSVAILSLYLGLDRNERTKIGDMVLKKIHINKQ